MKVFVLSSSRVIWLRNSMNQQNAKLHGCMSFIKVVVALTMVLWITPVKEVSSFVPKLPLPALNRPSVVFTRRTKNCRNCYWQAVSSLSSSSSLRSNNYDNEDFEDDMIDAEFKAFAASAASTKSVLEKPSFKSNNQSQSNTPSRVHSNQPSVSPTSLSSSYWQVELDRAVLDPSLSLSQRQSILSRWLTSSSNREMIRTSFVTALRDRTIDPLLTPAQRKIQHGTRAVARQVTNDILPSLAMATVSTASKGPDPRRIVESATNVLQKAAAATAAVISSGNNDSKSSKNDNSKTIEGIEDETLMLGRVGNRIFRAWDNQVRKTIQTLSADLQDPLARIPERITRQTDEFLKEAWNVFSETPVGLKGPKYTVVYQTDSYEVRDYESYYVATTSMISSKTITDTAFATSTGATTIGIRSTTLDDETDDGTNDIDGIWSTVAEQGAAFNVLASYLFGANQEQVALDMTTPVTTTTTGEMRFYIDSDNPPTPLDQENYENRNDDHSDTMWDIDVNNSNNKNKIRIERIPAARLAVRQFTGFVTPGEVYRQKQALLFAIGMDSSSSSSSGDSSSSSSSSRYDGPVIALDVPHGSPVQHIIFQYNPPYTIPFVRRNEIAIPVIMISNKNDDSKYTSDYTDSLETTVTATNNIPINSLLSLDENILNEGSVNGLAKNMSKP